MKEWLAELLELFSVKLPEEFRMDWISKAPETIPKENALKISSERIPSGTTVGMLEKTPEGNS